MGKEVTALPTPPAGSPPGPPPPRKRRYPQTNPGRLRADHRGSGAQRESDGAAGEADALGVGQLPVPTSFGARFVTDRALDQVILEFMAKLQEP